MNQPYSGIVRTPMEPTACLAIELRRVPDDLRNDLQKWVRTFAELWAYKHEQQPPATLWTKDVWVQNPDGHRELHLACSSKMPHYFLSELAEHLSQWIEKALKFTERTTVDGNNEWMPLFHWQDGKAWSYKDLDNWQDRDQTPMPHAPPPLNTITVSPTTSNPPRTRWKSSTHGHFRPPASQVTVKI